MEIENDISRMDGGVEREGEGNVVHRVFKPIFVFSFGVYDGLVVDKSGRTNQHETVLFDASVWSIPLHFVSGWLFTAPNLIHRPFI